MCFWSYTCMHHFQNNVAECKGPDVRPPDLPLCQSLPKQGERQTLPRYSGKGLARRGHSVQDMHKLAYKASGQPTR